MEPLKVLRMLKVLYGTIKGSSMAIKPRTLLTLMHNDAFKS